MTAMITKPSPDTALAEGRAYLDHISPMVEWSARSRGLPPRLTALCLRALADTFDDVSPEPDIVTRIRECLPEEMADALLHPNDGTATRYRGLHHIGHLLRTGEATVEPEQDGFKLVIYPLRSST